MKNTMKYFKVMDFLFVFLIIKNNKNLKVKLLLKY